MPNRHSAHSIPILSPNVDFGLPPNHVLLDIAYVPGSSCILLEPLILPLVIEVDENYGNETDDEMKTTTPTQ